MRRPKYKYQDFLDELAAGRAYGVFVDDTGAPGLSDTPANFHPERKSWVAVIVPPYQMPEVLEQLPGALQELERLTGAREFHFADIYAGRREFKGIDLQVRLALFEFMAHIFSVYQFPIIVQTFDPETLSYLHSRSEGKLPDRLPPFDFTKPEDTALFFLLIRVKWFMEQTPEYPKVKARVFIDEGWKRNGVAIRIPTFEDVFGDGLVCFCQSSSILPIQLADFAAFALNRTQLIGGRNKRSSLDIHLLKILSKVVYNYVNIEKKIVPLAEIIEEGPIITLADTRPHGPS
jgi:hypothetical protein